MTYKSMEGRVARSRLLTDDASVRVKELAEAGANGQALTPTEVRQVCEALRAQSYKVRNQFHNGII